MNCCIDIGLYIDMQIASHYVTTKTGSCITLFSFNQGIFVQFSYHYKQTLEEEKTKTSLYERTKWPLSCLILISTCLNLWPHHALPVVNICFLIKLPKWTNHWREILFFSPFGYDRSPSKFIFIKINSILPMKWC